MKHDTGKRPAVVRESGKQRRLEIIEAALRVIARDGLRAVSHRAVAAEAAVPLAATTYYFHDLADLIAESFLYWSSAQQANVCLLYTSPSPRDRTRSRMPSSA